MALITDQTWTLTKQKLDGSSHSWQAHLIGTDQHGHWLFAPAGTPTVDGEGRLLNLHDQDGVQLLPAAGWTAWWWADGSITIDLATQPGMGDRRAEYLDLALDLWRRGTEHGVADEDEYGEARRSGQIADAQAALVEQDLAWLQAALAERVEPFGAVGWGWLQDARRAALNLRESDDRWPLRFAATRSALLPQLPIGSRIEHIGSTAVPGLMAKDCIDLAVIVPGPDQLGAAAEVLTRSGYQLRPQSFDDPEHLFGRLTEQGRRVEHVHLYPAGHPELARVLALRDLLRVDPRARHRYGRLKQELASAHPLDRGHYIHGKDALVQELTEQAWARSQRQHPTDPVPSVQTELELNGITVAVHELGERRPGQPSVLVLHGGPDVGHRYLLPGLTALGRDHHVVTFDFRGTGGSGRGLAADLLQPELVIDDALALLDHLDLELVDLVGFSTGGRAAIELVRRAPARVRRLVLASTSGMPPGAEARYRVMDPDHQRRLDAEQQAQGRLRNLAVMIQDLWQVPDQLALIADCNEGDWSYERAVSGEQHPWVNGDPVEILTGFGGPVLIVHGAHDRGFPLPMAQWLHDQLPGSRIAVVADAAHLVPVERPELWAGYLRSFLAAGGAGWE